MNEQETVADIIAEMRHRIAVKMSDAWYTQEEWRKLCDRLEAAHKRELDALNKQITDLRQQRDLWSKRAAELVEKCNEQYAELKQAGNAAKLREALEFADRELRMATEDDRYGTDLVYLVGCMRTVAGTCRAALAATENEGDAE